MTGANGCKRLYYIETQGFDTVSALGYSAGELRIESARALVEAGYFKKVGDALRVVRVRRVQED